jgi:hypothetical protein
MNVPEWTPKEKQITEIAEWMAGNHHGGDCYSKRGTCCDCRETFADGQISGAASLLAYLEEPCPHKGFSQDIEPQRPRLYCEDCIAAIKEQLGE